MFVKIITTFALIFIWNCSRECTVLYHST